MFHDRAGGRHHQDAAARGHLAYVVARIRASVGLVVVMDPVVVHLVAGAGHHHQARQDEHQNASGIAERLIVVHAHVGGVFDFEPADVARRDVVVHANVVRLADVNAGVVGTCGHVVVHPPAA